MKPELDFVELELLDEDDAELDLFDLFDLFEELLVLVFLVDAAFLDAALWEAAF